MLKLKLQYLGHLMWAPSQNVSIKQIFAKCLLWPGTVWCLRKILFKISMKFHFISRMNRVSLLTKVTNSSHCSGRLTTLLIDPSIHPKLLSLMVVASFRPFLWLRNQSCNLWLWPTGPISWPLRKGALRDVLSLFPTQNIPGLLYSTGSSAQSYVAAWMGGEFGGKWIRVYACLSPLAVHLKLSQHC